MGGRLTTHVLDTGRGRPAAGMVIRLWRLEGGARILLAETLSNHDGRTDAPLLMGEALRPGQYELVFGAGDYLRREAGLRPEARGDGDAMAADRILFLDEIPIRFGIDDASQHYHVPLLFSPFAFSTYRGS